MLRYILSLSIAETAAVVGRTEGAVKQLQLRGRWASLKGRSAGSAAYRRSLRVALHPRGATNPGRNFSATPAIGLCMTMFRGIFQKTKGERPRASAASAGLRSIASRSTMRAGSDPRPAGPVDESLVALSRELSGLARSGLSGRQGTRLGFAAARIGASPRSGRPRQPRRRGQRRGHGRRAARRGQFAPLRWALASAAAVAAVVPRSGRHLQRRACSDRRQRSAPRPPLVSPTRRLRYHRTVTTDTTDPARRSAPRADAPPTPRSPRPR